MDDTPESGLQAVLLANRVALLRFLQAHGAGDAAEDLLQELWFRVRTQTGPVGQPLAYLYRAANNLMIDRYRARYQAERRDQEWTETTSPTLPGQSDTPGADRSLMAREALLGAQQALDALGERAATAFRLHRVEDVPQRDIAARLGVSLSTVESDLRRAYAAMIAYRRSLDEV